MKKVFITGTGSGIGYELAQKYLSSGAKVYAVGRKASPILDKQPNFFFFPCDLSDTFLLQAEINDFILNNSFDIAILTAEILWDIKELRETTTENIKKVMDINVWANKELIDSLNTFCTVKQIVVVSSGIAISGSKGSGAYSISKSSLNTMISIFAKELPDIHLSVLATGVIKTSMVNYILANVSHSTYPLVDKISNGVIISADEAAKQLIPAFEKLLEYESGSYVDIRKMYFR
ncbi:MAG: SDR family NAD(P)-dependent oxidoreductase [Campylobacterota bacterium]|nr:SDR family NAD(P)-dependent oxidoreductase [Campylobacterota bacterium]